MPRLFSALCFAALLAFAPVASAGPLSARTHVRTADLDLSSGAGAQRMLRRIERAADLVCEESVARRYPSAQRAFDACREATIATTIAQLGAPRVSDAYARNHGYGAVEIARR